MNSRTKGIKHRFIGRTSFLCKAREVTTDHDRYLGFLHLLLLVTSYLLRVAML